MLLKLAMRNMRRSVRDYVIYFVTLIFGVALFYAFNSISSQSILFDLEEMSSADFFETIEYAMSLFSLAVAFALGFLVLYSNQFVIRRRKREFGTYEVLGMSGGQVSRIMLYETVVVGVLSLIIGLLLGIIVSQGLSFFTASLFGATISNYQFVFSPEALTLTIICFVVIFAVVALFNVISVNRYRLITLLQSESKSQSATIKNPWVALFVFVLSIGILAYGYNQLYLNGMIELGDDEFKRATVAMLVGTLGFFWSISGFVCAILVKMKGFYLRGIRPFTVRQLASRINTAFLSIWAVCVLLFISISTFSIGMGLVDVFVGGTEKANPYDATLTANVYTESERDWNSSLGSGLDARGEAMKQAYPELYAEGQAIDWSIEQPLADASPALWEETVCEAVQLDFYSTPGQTYSQLGEDLLGINIQQEFETRGIYNYSDIGVTYVASSQVNQLLEMMGESGIYLADDECLVANNFEATKWIAESLASSDETYELLGHQLHFSNQILEIQLEDSALQATAVVVIAPDGVVDAIKDTGAIPLYSKLNLMYADNGKTAMANQNALADMILAIQPKDLPDSDGRFGVSDLGFAQSLWPVSSVITKQEMLSQSGGLKMMVTYLAVYIGLVFLLTVAAILTIQQLSNIVDSQSRYRMLWRLGCSAKTINRSILAQVVIYFFAPLVVAVCHAACVIVIMSSSLFDLLGVSVLNSVVMCAVLVAVIYGVYMAITFFVGRAMVRPCLMEG